jgi:hypothetical protein
MLKLTIAVLAVALAGSASAAGWRSLRVDGSSEDGFTKSVAAFEAKLSPARYYVFLRALQDVWVAGTNGAEAGDGEYTDADYLRQLDGLTYEDVVTFTDPSGETARERYQAAYSQYRASHARATPPPNAKTPWPEQPAPIGPHGEQVRGIVDSGPAYQHSLRTMGQVQ